MAFYFEFVWDRQTKGRAGFIMRPIIMLRMAAYMSAVGDDVFVHVRCAVH